MRVRYSFPRYRGTLLYPEAKERAIKERLNPDNIQCLDWYISGETIKIELTDDSDFLPKYAYVPGHGLIRKDKLPQWAARRNIIIENDGTLTWPDQEVELQRWKDSHPQLTSATKMKKSTRGKSRKPIVILD